MIDNQDKCEWVNVSSGTGSSGQFQTKGCKTAVVVLLLETAVSLLWDVLHCNTGYPSCSTINSANAIKQTIDNVQFRDKTKQYVQQMSDTLNLILWNEVSQLLDFQQLILTADRA